MLSLSLSFFCAAGRASACLSHLTGEGGEDPRKTTTKNGLQLPESCGSLVVLLQIRIQESRLKKVVKFYSLKKSNFFSLKNSKIFQPSVEDIEDDKVQYIST
jgi:hypothetical protein